MEKVSFKNEGSFLMTIYQRSETQRLNDENTTSGKKKEVREEENK